MERINKARPTKPSKAYNSNWDSLLVGQHSTIKDNIRIPKDEKPKKSLFLI